MKLEAAARLKAADEDYKLARQWLWKGDAYDRLKRLIEFVHANIQDTEPRRIATDLKYEFYDRKTLIKHVKVLVKAVTEYSKGLADTITTQAKEVE